MQQNSSLFITLKNAIQNTILSTLAQHPNEHFYYISLVTTENALSPCLGIWSEEALARASQHNPEEAYFLKWSYADSPYTVYDQYGFEEVQALWLPQDHCEDTDENIQRRFDLMLNVLKTLDHEGFFATHFNRNTLLLNLEIVSPDHTNTLRAIELNPQDSHILPIWIEEAAEK